MNITLFYLQARQITVSTDDSEVKAQLRKYGEPICKQYFTFVMILQWWSWWWWCWLCDEGGHNSTMKEEENRCIHATGIAMEYYLLLVGAWHNTASPSNNRSSSVSMPWFTRREIIHCYNNTNTTIFRKIPWPMFAFIFVFLFQRFVWRGPSREKGEIAPSVGSIGRVGGPRQAGQESQQRESKGGSVCKQF